MTGKLMAYGISVTDFIVLNFHIVSYVIVVKRVLHGNKLFEKLIDLGWLYPRKCRVQRRKLENLYKRMWYY